MSITKWLPKSIINYNINNAVNQNQNKDKDPTLQFPKKLILLT